MPNVTAGYRRFIDLIAFFGDFHILWLRQLSFFSKFSTNAIISNWNYFTFKEDPGAVTDPIIQFKTTSNYDSKRSKASQDNFDLSSIH